MTMNVWVKMSKTPHIIETQHGRDSKKSQNKTHTHTGTYFEHFIFSISCNRVMVVDEDHPSSLLFLFWFFWNNNGMCWNREMVSCGTCFFVGVVVDVVDGGGCKNIQYGCTIISCCSICTICIKICSALWMVWWLFWWWWWCVVSTVVVWCIDDDDDDVLVVVVVVVDNWFNKDEINVALHW